MPFLILGIIIIGFGIFFRHEAKKSADKEGVIGSTGLILAGIILIIFFGFFYRHLILLGN